MSKPKRGKKWQIVVPKDFISTNREYHLNGRDYQRVTAAIAIIAKLGLMNWKGTVGHAKANKILETRQVIGTHVHKLIETTLKGEDINLGIYEKEIQDDMLNFYKFQKAAKLKPDGLEQKVWSNKHGYAGTPDYIGNYTTPEEFLMSRIVNHKRVKLPKFAKGGYVIGDWKTAKNIYPEYWLQIAAYAMAFYELTGIKVDGGFILRLRDGTLKLKEMTWDELTIEFKTGFLHALKLYEWKYKKR